MCWVLFHFFLPFGFFSLSSFQLFPTPSSLFFLFPSSILLFPFSLPPPAGRPVLCLLEPSLFYHGVLITLVFILPLVGWLILLYLHCATTQCNVIFFHLFSSYLFLVLYLLPLFPYYSLPRITMFILLPPFFPSFPFLFFYTYLF